MSWLLHLDINKSTGTDNIGPLILKVSAPFIVSPLTYIFNRIIDSGIYPNKLKNANVSPIFKSRENVSLRYHGQHHQRPFFRSKIITTLTFPLFISSIHLSMMLIKAIWQEWFDLNLQFLNQGKMSPYKLDLYPYYLLYQN
jgi:hypothetical protein